MGQHSPDVTLGGDHVTVLDVEQVAQVDLIAIKRTKLNSWKWVKKHEFPVGELDKLKLKTVILHGDWDEEVHMTQSVGFVAAKSVSAGWACLDKLHMVWSLEQWVRRQL